MSDDYYYLLFICIYLIWRIVFIAWWPCWHLTCKSHSMPKLISFCSCILILQQWRCWATSRYFFYLIIIRQHFKINLSANNWLVLFYGWLCMMYQENLCHQEYKHSSKSILLHKLYWFWLWIILSKYDLLLTCYSSTSIWFFFSFILFKPLLSFKFGLLRVYDNFNCVNVSDHSNFMN